MNLALAPWNRRRFDPERRKLLEAAAGGLAALSLFGPAGLAAAAPAAESSAPASGTDEFRKGRFLGDGPKDFETGQEWIRTFFESATKICDFYHDDFVFEDVSLFQTISTKDELFAAFAPFENKDPDSPIGVHWFDVIRYDGTRVPKLRPQLRKKRSADFTDEEYARFAPDIQSGASEYDEFAMMQWIWKAQHAADFLGMPAKGKTTITRGITYHAYRDRRIVREYTFWNVRHVAIQLGVLEEPVLFWKKPAKEAT